MKDSLQIDKNSILKSSIFWVIAALSLSAIVFLVWISIVFSNIMKEISITEEESVDGVNKVLNSIGYDSFRSDSKEDWVVAQDAFGSSRIDASITNKDAYLEMKSKIASIYGCEDNESNIVCAASNPSIELYRVSQNESRLIVTDQPGSGKNR